MLRTITYCNNRRVVPIARRTILNPNGSHRDCNSNLRVLSSYSALLSKGVTTESPSLSSSLSVPRSNSCSLSSSSSSSGSSTRRHQFSSVLSSSSSSSVLAAKAAAEAAAVILYDSEMPLTAASHHRQRSNHQRSINVLSRRSINTYTGRNLKLTTAALLAILGTSFTNPLSRVGTAAFSSNMSTTTKSSSTPLSSTVSPSDANDDKSQHPLANIKSNLSQSWIKNLSPETPANRLKSKKSIRGDDGVSNNVRRPVYNGHYVPVRPKPLTDPRLILYSPSVANDLGLAEDAIFSHEFARFFSGDVDALGVTDNEIHTWATPYALSIMGTKYTSNCPFGTGDGYGDGRAIYIGEVTLPTTTTTTTTPRRFELQLKGAGPTPFCRGADGRAVLRSSLREFLASEAMHTLGISTTRALSLVVSDGGDTSTRPWYSAGSKRPEVPSVDDPRLERFGGLGERKRVIAQISAQSKVDPDVMVEERNAITCRVAKSFVRVGHVDLFARRVRNLGEDDEEMPDIGTEEFGELRDLVWHACQVEYPDLCYESFKEQGDLIGASKCLIEQSMEGISTMVAEWVRVGFAQGNFNGDNCLVAGRTMDYGPFGFMDEYNPLFAKWTGSGDHFGFMNQPKAGYANFAILVSSIMPIVEGYSNSMAEAKTYEEKLLKKAQGVFQEKLAAVFRIKMGFHPSDNKHDHLWNDLEPILAETRADWTLFWRQLTTVVKEYPVIGREGAGGHISTSNEEVLTLLQGDDEAKPGSSAFYTPLDTESKMKLLKWIQAWREALVDSYGDDGSSTVLSQKDADLVPPEERMRLANPKYVLREWMMVEAYSKASPETVSSSSSIFKPAAAASQSDESLIHKLFELILNPYDEGTEEQDKKYYRRAPDSAMTAGGTAFMS